MKKLEFIAFESSETRGEWRVEAVDETTGEVYVTLFYGPKAEERAKEYVRWAGK